MYQAEVLTMLAALQWLKAFGLPVVETRPAGSVEEVVALAREFGFPVVLKIDSSAVSHKSDIGGVRLNLSTEEEVVRAFKELRKVAKSYDPEAGVTVQPMLSPLAEVIIGMHTDPQFGPVLAFGIGGTLVELLEDLSWRLLPLGKEEARAVLREVKGASLLWGYRGRPQGDVEALADLLGQVATLVQSQEDVISLDLNPVLLFPQGHGVAIADARLVRGKRKRRAWPLPPRAKLQRLFAPGSVAVVGASPERRRLGYTVIENLLRDGYRGEIYPVNPAYEQILGLKAYPSLRSLPTAPDAVVSAVNPEATIELAKDCAAAHAGGLVVYASGFKEMGAEGEALEQRLGETCAALGLPCLGPNSPGFINTHLNLSLVFFPFRLRRGGVSLVTQSGGVGGALYRQAMEEGLGIAKWIGVGNRLSLGFAAALDYLGGDPETQVIGVYMEGADDAREFALKAREVVRHKPVLVYKVGTNPAASQAALTHTGALAGSPALYQAIFRQHGVLLARDAFSLISGCKALALAPLPQGNRLGIITITGGGSVIILDRVMAAGCALAELSPATQEAVRSLLGERAPVLVQNPLDLTMYGFQAKILLTAMEAVLADPAVDLLLAMIPIHPYYPFPFEKVPQMQEQSGKPIVLYWVVQDVLPEELRRQQEELQAGGVPVYTMAEQAAWGTGYLVQYAQIRAGQGLASGWPF